MCECYTAQAVHTYVLSTYILQLLYLDILRFDFGFKHIKCAFFNICHITGQNLQL